VWWVRFSGLLGIGGGALIVPFLYLLIGGVGWSGLRVLPEHEAALAHATSLALIIPTALSGLLAYRRRGLVSWSVVIPLGVGAGLTAILGARVAIWLPALILKTLFGGFLILMAWTLVSGTPPPEPVETQSSGRMRWPAALGGGGIVGFMSALLGVGGGVVAIPILIQWVRMDLSRVAAASLGIIAFAAVAGTLGYALAGWGVEGLPPGSAGFVHLPLLFAMLPGALLMAPVGAAWNHRLPTAVLRRAFSLFLLVVGVALLWTNGRELVGW
jgi:uncharacterized protein